MIGSRLNAPGAAQTWLCVGIQSEEASEYAAEGMAARVIRVFAEGAPWAIRCLHSGEFVRETNGRIRRFQGASEAALWAEREEMLFQQALIRSRSHKPE